jgi:hypothetical protein
MTMILLGEYIFIFPSPACNKCILVLQVNQKLIFTDTTACNCFFAYTLMPMTSSGEYYSQGVYYAFISLA